MRRLRVDKGPEQGACAVVGYIRVSSPSQDYAYQRDAIERAASARGERIAHWFADVASGRSMDRPELQRLRASLDSGAVSRVWVWRLDRLSRSGIVATFEAVEHIRRCGAELASVADGFALEGPAADLVLAVMAWGARLEREKIRENQTAARARLESNGGRWGRPRLPPLEPHQVDAARALRSQGKTKLQIARALNLSRKRIDLALGKTDRRRAS